jgi:hypothetical protein
MNRLSLTAVLTVTLLGLGVQGCKKKKREVQVSEASAVQQKDSPAKKAKKAVPLKRVRIPGAPLQVKIPTSWKRVNLAQKKAQQAASPKKAGPDGGTLRRDGGPVVDDGGPGLANEDEPVEAAGVVLVSKEILAFRAPPAKKGALPLRFQVFHDPDLPLGTTVTRYQRAQRKAGLQGMADIEHVEAERSRRDGRPAYFVRDTFSVPLGDKDPIYITQVSLLLIEAIDGVLHGYTVVATLLDQEYASEEATLRAVFDSVHFDPKK